MARGGEETSDLVVRRSRRAFARRQWARRWVSWKYALVAVLLLALLVGGGWLVMFSSVLAVKTVAVEGEQRLGAAQVRAVADVTAGEPLARLDLEAVTARVKALALVRDAEVTRQWPDTLRIAVEERTAVAVVDIGGRLRGLDVDGVVFDDFGSPADLPRVQASPEPGREALREAAAVISALPEGLSARVDHIEVATVDQVELVLRDGRRVVWGSADQSDLKAEVLTTLLGQKGATYDVSVPAQPTVRP